MIILIMLFIMLVLMVLLSVAFLTLFERKLLGYMQLRKGPDKVFYCGVFQPMADGLKLLMKESNKGVVCNKWLYMGFPCFYFVLSLTFWFTYDFFFLCLFVNSLMAFILLSGLGVYSLMGAGWSSNSKYSLMGSYRSVAQTISYEVGLVFMLMVVVYFMNSFSFSSFCHYSSVVGVKLYLYVFFLLVWVLIMLAELNRSPFDFAESESELVSGFNIEYGSGSFVMLFLSEYMSIIYMSYLSVLIFFSNNSLLFVVLMVLVFIWVRGVLPRFRYDNLMYMNWKIFLPILLMMIMVEVCMSVLFF